MNTSPSNTGLYNQTGSGRLPENDTLSYQDTFPSTIRCEPIDSLPLAIVSGAVATATIFANLLVIIAILRGSAHFHRPIYWVIIHLSFADLIVGIMLLWNYCFASLFKIDNTYKSLLMVFCLWISSEASSTIGFVLLAIDRYVQIFHKHFHRAYATRVTVGTCIAFAWVYSLGVFSIAPMFGWSCQNCTCPRLQYMQCMPMTECSQILPPFTKSYTLTIACMLMVCIPVPVAIYGTIFFKVRQAAPRVLRQSKRRHDMRLIKTLSVILIVFIITLSPVAILLFFDYTQSERDEVMISIAFYIFVLAFLNSLANPLLYIWRMKPIRTSIRKLLCFSNAYGSRRDITSHYYSENRSPTMNRHDAPESRFLATDNNNKPHAVTLCLRQIKRGRYTNSKTSTPLSDRACNHRHKSIARISRDIDRELESDNPEDRDRLDGGQANGGNCVVTGV